MKDTIWRGSVGLDELNRLAPGTMIEQLGIIFTEIGHDFLRGTMPVDFRTLQPFGILHGGAFVVLAETLGSIAAILCVDRQKESCVGLNLSSNHLRRVTDGIVTGTARPLHVGRRTHIWEIHVENSEGVLLHVTRLTMLTIKAQNLARTPFQER